MAKVTVSQHIHNEYFPANLEPAFARVYYDQPFTTSTGETVGAGSLDSQNYVAQVACTYADGSTTIPSFATTNQIDSTTYGTSDPIGVLATCTLTLHNAHGKRVAVVYSGLIVPTVSPTTWENLSIYTNAPRQPFRFQYYTATQVDTLFEGLDLAPDASDVIAGKVFLDVAPASPALPIAVGVNSPRVSKVLSADYGNSLATAITSIGATPTLLVVKANTTVSTALIVPSTLVLKQENGAVITKAGSGAITFLGYGLDDPTSRVPLFANFGISDILWTGTVFPPAISTELWDTANVSLTDRVKRADAAMLAKPCKLVAYPRTITNTATITEQHHLYFTEGTYANTLDTWGTTNMPAFLLKDNTRVSGSNLAYVYESPNDNNGYLFYSYPMVVFGSAGQCSNIIIEDMNFVGDEAGAFTLGGVSLINLGNCQNSLIRRCKFTRTHAYAAVLGSFGTDGFFAYNSGIENCLFVGIGGQNADILNGKNCWIRNCHFDQTDSNNASSYVCIDLEPNGFSDVLDNIFIEENTFDFTNENNTGAKYGSAIAAQAASIGQANAIFIRNNIILGREITPTVEYGPLQNGIAAYGIQEVVIEGNYIRGAYSVPMEVRNCRYARVVDNDLMLCSSVDGLFTGILAWGAANSDFVGNRLNKAYTGNIQSAAIREIEIEIAVTSSGSTVTNLKTPAVHLFYEWWQNGMSITLNGTDYVVSTVTTPTQVLTTGSAVGSLPIKTASSATDINTGTDTITLGAHNFINGARVRYTAGSVAVGGLTTGVTYFVVGRTGTTIQLALTLGGAVIDLTSTGTGTQTFTPILITKFSSNTYALNKADDGILLEPTGTSLILSDYRRVISDSIAVSITSNQNNYNPGRNAHRVDVTTDASRNITGLVFTSPPPLNGEKHEIYNAGSFNLVIVHDATSTAANRFWNNTLADITVLPGQRVQVEYNSTISRWMAAAYNVTITAASLPTGIDATKIADGSVTSAEFQFISTLSSNAQTQIDLKAPLISPSFTTPALGVATGTSLTATGLIKSTGTAGIGYGTGAGGAQTQSTDKSTTVVSNTITTAVTMNNAALNLDTAVSFTFTNSTITATDTVICIHQSAGTSGAYVVNAFPGAGSAVVTVRNVSTSNLSEAIVLRITVIKSVSS